MYFTPIPISLNRCPCSPENLQKLKWFCLFCFSLYRSQLGFICCHTVTIFVTFPGKGLHLLPVMTNLNNIVQCRHPSSSAYYVLTENRWLLAWTLSTVQVVCFTYTTHFSVFEIAPNSRQNLISLLSVLLQTT